jgi:VWFA-related protein
MRARLVVILVCGCLLATIALVAQDIPPDELYWSSMAYVPEIAATPVIRVESNLVEVATVVRDSHEKPVGNLKKDDFLVFDNGKPQTISTFSILAGSANSAAPTAGLTPNAAAPGGPTSVPDSQPRYVALFFDDANTTMPNINFAREGAIKFIRKGLDPGERVGVFTASGTLTLDFTNDVQKLLDSLAKLKLFPRMPNQSMSACPPLGTYQAWVINHFGGRTDELRDAENAARACGCTGYAAESCARTEAAAVTGIAEDYSLGTLHAITYVIRRLSQMPGRRVLLLTSSGFLTLSFGQETQKVVEAAVRANVVINSLDSAGLPANWDRYGSHFSMVLPMSDLAAGTGGQFIHNNNDLAGGMQTLSAEPAVSYMLGFSPTNLKVDGTEHKLKVKLVEPSHLTVEARPHYYAPSAELSPAEKRFHKLQVNVMASKTPAEIPIQFTATPGRLASGESSLKILVHVDIRKLEFENIGDRKAERLIFITALFDTKNEFMTGVEGVMDLRLKEATLKQLSEQGLDAKLSIQAPAGSYRVRQVVQESVGGRVAAVGRAVEMH